MSGASTLRQRIIAYFEQTDNDPASYYDLMAHVTASATLAQRVAEMLEDETLVEVEVEDAIYLKLKG